MHGAIWKLSAVATVVGFGLLAVVLQQRGLGKGTAQAVANANEGEGTGDANAADSTASNAADDQPGAGQQGELGPSVPVPPAPKKKADLLNSDDPSDELTETADDAAEFAPKGTSPRATASRTGRRTQNALTEDSDNDSALADRAPKSINSTGTRGGQPTAVEHIDATGTGSQTNEFDTANPDNSALSGDENDTFDRSQVRPPRPRGQLSPSDGEGPEAEVVAQAPNSRRPSMDEFEDDSSSNPTSQSRTTPRTAPLPRNRPNPRQALVGEEDGERREVAPTGGQIVDQGGDPVDTQFAPMGTPDASDVGATGGSRARRLNSALQDSDDDGLPRRPRSGTGNGADENFNNGAETGTDFRNPSGNSPVVQRNLPSIEPDPEESLGTTSPGINDENVNSTPPVPSSRKRPSIDDEESGDGLPRRRNSAVAGPTVIDPTGSDPNAPQPIPKLDRQTLEMQEMNSAPSANSNRRGRPNSLAEDEDAGGDVPPAMFPMGRQRPRLDLGTDEESASRDVQPGNAPPSNPSEFSNTNDPSISENGTVSPITNPPERTGTRGRNSRTTRPRFEDDQPDAAASGDSATNVIAPRMPAMPAGDVGGIRGRAKVTIEKIAPPTALLGQPLIYSIIVRNNGTTAARQVVVEDDVPDGVTMQGSIPQAEMTGRKLKWNIGSLEIGQEQRISVKVIPTAEGPVGSAATVNFVHDGRSTTGGVDPAANGLVALELQSPQNINVGQSFEVRFRLTNLTNRTLTQLTIINQLPEILRHESRRQDLEYPIKALAPRETLDVTLSLTASQTGLANSRAFVMTQDETILESKQFNVNVIAE